MMPFLTHDHHRRKRRTTLAAICVPCVWLACLATFTGVWGGSSLGWADERSLNRTVEILEEITPIIRDCVEATDTMHTVFHGCIDWHSAVHGHWALLRAARAAPSLRFYGEWAAARLTADALKREAEYIRDHPQFERPYGRAWLLRLAIEYETWSGAYGGDDLDAMQVLAELAASSLRAYYTTRTPSPLTRDYNNDAWVIYQLHDYYAQAQGGVPDDVTALMTRLRNDRARIGYLLDYEAEDFFSRFGNWVYTVARTQPMGALQRFLRLHPVADEALQPVRNLRSNAHHLGMNWSRAWSLRAIAAKLPEAEGERFRLAYWQHVNQAMVTHTDYATDYQKYAHWVPQFAVYALTDN